MVISLTVLWQLFDCFIFDSFALFVPNPGIKHCSSPPCIFHVSSYLTSLCMYFPVKYYLGDCNENMLWLCRQNGAGCRDRRRALPSYLFLGLSQLPPLTLQKPPLNFLPAQPWAPFDFLVLLMSQEEQQQRGFQYHGCLDFANHTLPGNFKIKSQWHFYQLLCLKTTIFKHRFQKRQYFDLLSRQRLASVPLVLFSASLWDQLSKILNRDLFFHNLLVFLHHSQLLANLRAKSWEK